MIQTRSVATPLVFDVDVKEVTNLVFKLPAKQCILDPVPTWLIKKTVNIMAPLLSYMCNVSLESGQFAAVCKKAVVLPRLKKPPLDVSADLEP